MLTSENSVSLPTPFHCDVCGNRSAPLHAAALCPRCALSMALAAGDDAGELPHDLFPELEIEGPLASGGFGHVVKARHRRMERPVALKSLDDLLARSAETRALFTREMAAAGRLDHPGIVRAYDAGERDGHWYLITEYIAGMDTGALVRRHGRLPVAEACEIVRQAALALHYAHGRGLIHRDVKPGNLMLSSGTDGPCAVKVLDFGLAAAAGAQGHAGGTPGYTAPEMLRPGTAADARADVFSLGATLRRFLTGQPPPGAAGGEFSLSVQRTRLGAVGAVPLPVSPAAEPPALARQLIALCDRCTAADPSQRPQSAEEVAALLAPWAHGAYLARLFTEGPLEEKPFVFPKKNRRALWAAVAALVAISAFVFLRPGSAPPGVPKSDPPYRPLFSDAYFQKEHISPDSGPRLFSEAWERELEFQDSTYKQFARLAPDGGILSVDRGQDHSIRHRDERGNKDAFLLPEKPSEIAALGVGPDGHVVWAMPQDKTGLHIGRARPDGTLLPTLRYDFAADFTLGPLQLPAGAYELGRKLAINAGLAVADGEPRGFAFVTPENLPANTGLRPGDVVVADFGQRQFWSGFGLMPGTRERVGNIMSIPGLWRFRLDDDEPVRRLAKGKPSQMFLDVAVATQGVFALDRVFTDLQQGPPTDPSHRTDHLWRWDLDGWHACTTDQPLLNPSGIAADPLSPDLYILCGDETIMRSSERQSIHRLTPAGPDRYTVTPFVTRLGSVDRGGIAFSYDGKRMIITDYGNRIVVVLKRK